jgi:dTDP-4-amino-4,6-dideoxygalactose transaminase
MIPITKPFLPPIEDFIYHINSIWEREWLTNQGPVLSELEMKLKEYLKVNHLLFLSNGTIAIQLAIKALGLKGEIITTPYSYVATTSSIVWEGLTPVFVDIDSDTLNINPDEIEKSITSNTCAILATHVFGNPCDVEKIDKIAKKYNLKVIYDAAHAFGVKVGGKSIFEYGDISTTSFHATKLFHTVEGGAVITKEPELLRKIALMKGFGHTSPTTFEGVGINGKNSEFHAAMGLCNLKYIDQILAKRKEQVEYYNFIFSKANVKTQLIFPNCEYNYSYYPVILDTEEITLKAIRELEGNYIYPRRYFYPSLNTLSYLANTASCPISEKIALGSLCLPLYYNLHRNEPDLIGRILLRVINN